MIYLTKEQYIYIYIYKQYKTIYNITIQNNIHIELFTIQNIIHNIKLLTIRNNIYNAIYNKIKY